MKLKLKFLFLIVLLCSKAIFAFDTVIIEKKLEEQILGKNIYFLEDTEKDLEIEEILNPKKPLRWNKNKTDVPNFGFTNRVIWASLSLQNNLEDDANYLLEIDFPRLDYIDFYQVVDEKIEKKSSGNLIAFDNREIKYRNPVFEICIPAKKARTFYFKFESKTVVQFPLILHSRQKFEEKLNKEQLLHGFHFGILLLSTLYGILLFRLMKDWGNLLFSLYSISVLFIFLILTGIGFQYFWKNNPEINHLNSFAIVSSLGFGLQFSRVILNLEKYSKKANILFNWLTVIILILFVLLFFIPYSIGLKIGMIATIIEALLIVSMGFITSLKNYKPAIYIFIASIFGLMEWSTRILNLFAIIQFDLSFTDTILIRCTERIILCLALIVKVQVIKEENESIQARRLEDEFKIQEELSSINAEMEKQVTERTKDLEREKEIAIKANRLKDTFITTVSHDLKSPILNTKNLLDILIQKEEMDWEERLYYLQACQSALTSSYQMVYNILNLDRFESGNVELNHQYIDLNSVLNKVIQELEYSYKLKNIAIELAAKEDLILIGDHQLLLQLFLNLVSNAIKFSFKNSIIKIKVSELKNYFKIEIIDSGIGISDEDKNDLLTKSILLKEGTEEEKGTGFGLGIVRQILSIHDGYLEIESKIGKGSNFSVILPCHEKVAICFSEEATFCESIKNLHIELGIRIIYLEESKKILAAIQNLSPDYLLIGIINQYGRAFKELIAISQYKMITPTPVFIQDYSYSIKDFSDLKFSEIRINREDRNLISSLKEFLN